ncbi:hypothetical protein [Bacillus rubiinfantis]|uniref:hypothetical protein n=1 Tax=Bacillus rubiinfantis TaxID=1499680 RepID=UPI0005A8D0DD|nr:hypothetical protein [Bacillus rubiinfantis]
MLQIYKLLPKYQKLLFKNEVIERRKGTRLIESFYDIENSKEGVFNLVKGKKKYLISFLLSFCIFGAFTIPALAGSSKQDCSWAGVQCKQVNVTYFTNSAPKVFYSDSIYAIYGQSLSVSNSSTGAFNLVTQLVDSSGNVFTPEIAFHNTVYAKVP